MSLINDALKRAKQAQQKITPASAAGSLRPAGPARAVNAPRSLLLPILAAAMLVSVGSILIVVAFSRGFRSKTDEPLTDLPAASSSKDDPGAVAMLSQATADSRATSSSVPPGAFQATQANNAQSPTTVPTVVTQSVLMAKSSNAAPVTLTLPEPELPKLQGILFNPARPTAFLNGKSVVVGGRAGEFTVVAITKLAVTVERAGQTNVLVMEE